MSCVLIVDDFEQNLYLLRVLLEGHQYTVHTAHNGVEALAVARQHPIDMIISDILMPEMDGFSLCREWKTDPQLKHIPFVFYTATYTDPKDEAFALGLGANRFLIKPQEPTPFLAALEEVLQAQQAGELPATNPVVQAEENYLKGYNQALIRKLEKKVLELQQANRNLQEEVEGRRQAETAMQTSQTRLNHAQEIGRLGSWECGMRLKHSHWCDQLYRMLGYNPHEIKPSYEAFESHALPEDRQRMRDGFVRALSERTPFETTFRFKTRQGHLRTARCRAVSLSGDTGKDQRLMCVLQDITEQASAEQERDRIILLSRDMFCIAGIDGYFKYLNPAWESVLGYTLEELLGRPFVAFIHPDDRDRTEAEVARLSSGLPTVDFENRYQTKSGTVRVISWMATPMAEEGLIYAVGRDITERKRTEQNLLAYQKRLKRLASELTLTEERLKRFIASQLHDEISQSLAMARVKASALRESLTEEKARQTLDNVCEVLDQALEQSRSLTSTLSYPTLNVLGLSKAIKKWLHEEVQEKHKIETSIEDDGRVRGLDEDVRAVLFRSTRELLTNAVKHAEAKRINVAVGKEADHIRIRVEDDGIGFRCPEDHCAAQEGGGFGILSVRESLERLGGHIQIESVPNKGAKVTMVVPMK